MQASQIKPGNRYAVQFGGSERPMRVAELVTVRDGRDTKNYVHGYMLDRDIDEPIEKVRVQVKNVIGDLAEHEALMKAQAEKEAKRKADAEAKKDKQKQAATLLAKAIGAQSVLDNRYGNTEWDREKPAVIVDTSGIELNEHALDPLIAFLEGVAKERKFFEGMNEPVPGWDPKAGRVVEQDLADQIARQVREDMS